MNIIGERKESARARDIFLTPLCTDMYKVHQIYLELRLPMHHLCCVCRCYCFNQHFC